MMTWIMLFCGFPTLWVIIAAEFSMTKVKKGYAMGLQIPDDEEKNDNLCKLLRRCRYKMLWFAGVASLLIIPMFWIPYESILFAAGMVWLMMVILIPMGIYGHYFNALKKLKRANDWTFGAEREAHWHCGFFYYNKDDPRILVPVVGSNNSTFHLARLPGKLLFGFTALCLFSLPFWGAWIVAEDFTEKEIQLSETAISAIHLETEYAVKFTEVETVTLLWEMPPCSRNSGYELTHLTKGNFSVDGYGKSKVCVDDRDEVVLVLETADNTYFISFPQRKTAETVINKIDL